jgi:hypothetical protein
MNYSWKGKLMDLVHETVNRVALWSMVDLRIENDRSLQECGLIGAIEAQSSTREDKKEEGCSGILTMRSDGDGALMTCWQRDD